MNSKETIERIYITKSDFSKIESDIRFQEHLRRYASVRRFCYGSVLDFACGCGYGTHILAVNPEISDITGIDIDEYAINWAKVNFAHEKITYVNQSFETFRKKIDTLVCLETIEHLKDVQEISLLVNRCDIDTLILSFPDKKSTHFNPFHYHDLVMQDIMDLFKDHILFHSFKLVDVQFVLFTKKPKKAPAHIYRNLHDLI